MVWFLHSPKASARCTANRCLHCQNYQIETSQTSSKLYGGYTLPLCIFKKNGGLHFSCWNYQQTVVLSLLGDTFGSLRHRNIRTMKRVVSLTCTWRVNAYYSRIRHNACNFTRISLIKKARKRVCKNVLITRRKSTGTYHKRVLRQECM